MKKNQGKNEMRSGCPINLTLEMVGDRWSLIVIRDMMFGNRRHYGELLRLSDEGIASNILANRLGRLVASGLVSRTENPSHKQKAIYSLTEASIQLVPLLAYMGAWGCRWTPASRQLSIRAQLLEEGGETLPSTPLSFSNLTNFAVEYRYDFLPDTIVVDRLELAETVRILREFVIRRITALTAQP